jgi:hypothetical protein
MEIYNSDILADAYTLKSNNLQKKQIYEAGMEILKKIKEELHVAHMHGNHHIVTELPLVYDIPNMTNADAQRLIWSQIIELLQKKNYVVYINYNKSLCKLKISWLNSNDHKEIARQSRIIQNSNVLF